MAGTIKHEWNGTTLIITSDSGTSSCDLKGDKGDMGIRGAQGIPGEPWRTLEMYPIGALYMSMDATSPSSLFGGTWEQITNKFIYAAGAGEMAGASGGSASHNHSLTRAYAKFCAATTGGSYYSEYNKSTGNVAEGETFSWLPEYYTYDATKYNTFANPWSVSGATELGGKTDNTNNLPPYITAYIWQRTA